MGTAFLPPDELLNLFFFLLTDEGSHREVYQELQLCYDIICRSGAQLLTLRQHRANNQYMISSNTQTTFEQSPIQVLTKLNVA